MSVSLRDYQKMAIDSARTTIESGSNRPLIISPTASGKSIIIAGIVEAAFKKDSKIRILVLCFQGEILAQNEKAVLSLCPEISTGIYCASLKRKETDRNIIFASRDSLARDPLACGFFNFVIVDEAHSVPNHANCSFGKIFEALGHPIIIGFTGTPWRLDNGRIWGTRGFFDKVAYNISMGLLIERGYLAPYKFPEQTNEIIKTDIVAKSATGDFNIEQLTALCSTDEILNQCLQTWLRLKKVDNRKVSIFFCCSLEHAAKVTGKLKSLQIETAYLDGTTKKKDRRQILKDCRAGKYEAIVNVGVLTTGVDIPVIDCVVMLRATLSASLYVQSIGRGLRLHERKKDCLIVDMTDNSARFGSIESPLQPKPLPPARCPNCKQIKLSGLEKCPGCGIDFKKGKAQTKDCQQCLTPNPTSAAKCSYCNEIFITHNSDFHRPGQSKGWFQVESYSWRYGQTKTGENCVIVDYKANGKEFSQWLLFERKWARKERAQIKDMEKREIEMICVDNINAKYPQVKVVLFKRTGIGRSALNSINNNFFS